MHSVSLIVRYANGASNDIIRMSASLFSFYFCEIRGFCRLARNEVFLARNEKTTLVRVVLGGYETGPVLLGVFP